jgi:hypothetical protein
VRIQKHFRRDPENKERACGLASQLLLLVSSPGMPDHPTTIATHEKNNQACIVARPSDSFSGAHSGARQIGHESC